MSTDIGKYIRFLRDLENGLVEDEEQAEKVSGVALLESELFEDNNMSFKDMANSLAVNEDDVRQLFDVLGSSLPPREKLGRISVLISGGGVESMDIEDTTVNYVVVSDMYDPTIVEVEGKFFYGPLGRLAETNNLSVLSRIS